MTKIPGKDNFRKERCILTQFQTILDHHRREGMVEFMAVGMSGKDPSHHGGGCESHSQIGIGLDYKLQKPTLSDPLLLARTNILKGLHPPQTGDISDSDCNSRIIEHIRVC